MRGWGAWLLALAAVGCSESGGGGPRADSETHWLGCEGDRECGEGFACLCGVCTVRCEAGCGADDGQVVCAPEAWIGEHCATAPAGGVCLPGCGADADCAPYGAASRCVEGHCAPRGEGRSDGGGGDPRDAGPSDDMGGARDMGPASDTGAPADMGPPGDMGPPRGAPGLRLLRATVRFEADGVRGAFGGEMRFGGDGYRVRGVMR